MNTDDDGFLARWSRRKAQVRDGTPPDAPPTVPAQAPAVAAPPDHRPADAALQATDTVPALSQADPPPTLEDVGRLTPESHFGRFVQRDVDPAVKNAALKRLFADPQFNVMDGLDIYIDDYGRPDPLPPSLLRKMAQAKALGLFTDDEPAEPRLPSAAGGAAPDGAPDAAPRPDPETLAHEDTDLRLQPHDAARCAGAEPGPEPHGGGQR